MEAVRRPCGLQVRFFVVIYKRHALLFDRRARDLWLADFFPHAPVVDDQVEHVLICANAYFPREWRAFGCGRSVEPMEVADRRVE